MRRIDDLNVIEIDGIRCCRGHSIPFGASILDKDTINFSVNSVDATGCMLELYHTGESQAYAHIMIPDDFRTGSNYSIIVYDQNPEDLEYTYRFYGEFDRSKGLRFNPEVPLLDPYAKLLSGRETWGAEDATPMRCRVMYEDYPWEGDRPLELDIDDLVIYELHVRGFTKDPSSGVTHGGTFRGVVEKIPYLKELGVNCVELLPVFEFDELERNRTYDGNRLLNFWGYSTVSFFAPKSGYAATGAFHMAADELKSMIKELHRNGIEVIFDVVFNHTAEMDDTGPTLNYRGIDNRTYYLLDQDGGYVNYSGCGNTVNCNNAIVREHILDCLRYWVSDYHVDGFRFDEAPILSRDPSGKPLKNPPLLETLAHDPILSRTKLIAEAWDAAGLYQVGSFPAPDRWAEWNGKFRDCVRHFVKSDDYAGPELIRRIQGSPDIYGDNRAHSTVNFITCHDGFTLNDNFSYNFKHNAANGEDNRDGIDNNVSWNCGVEGATDDPNVESLRNRIVKNAFSLLMLSRGTPMMLSGDEFRNTQNGNNNVWCQDGPLSWLDWSNMKKHKDVHDYFKAMIALRNAHPVMRSSRRTGHNSSGYPELSFHGTTPWAIDIDSPLLSFGFMYAEPASEFGVPEDSFIYTAVNSYWGSMEFTLPDLPEGFRWQSYADSAAKSLAKRYVKGNKIELEPRSIRVLVARRGK
ncbi:MAG: glycogen debranching enzyme [bacterium]|nr:glycogen debranching enzyme [bacterium]